MAIIIAGRMLGLLFLIMVTLAILYFMQRAYNGKIPNLRKLSVVDKIPEILGRCVEMGRPAWYLMGSVDFTVTIQLTATIAAFQTLAYTARLAARLGAKFFVPANYGLAYTMAHDVVENAYRAEDKLDSFDTLNTVMYLPSGPDRMYIINHMWEDQVAGVFMLGSWYHEAVIYSEVAAREGAVMFGATDTTHNIPFLVAICDYSLIGEELYALGAYVSQDPTQSSSLAGQDIAKYVAIVFIIIGVILVTTGMNISSIFKM
jgi:hypothetical protein